MSYSRIKVEMPAFYQHRWNYVLTEKEMNYGGHLGNDSVLSLAQLARIDFYKHLECSELDLGDKIGSIITASQIQYLAEGFLNDEIEMKLTIDDVSKRSFELFYLITKPNATIAKVRTSILAFDYRHKKVATLPHKFTNMVGLLDKQTM